MRTKRKKKSELRVKQITIKNKDQSWYKNQIIREKLKNK